MTKKSHFFLLLLEVLCYNYKCICNNLYKVSGDRMSIKKIYYVNREFEIKKL